MHRIFKRKDKATSKPTYQKQEECPQDCPLRQIARKGYQPILDAPLPSTPDLVSSYSTTERDLLYGSVKEWQTRLLLLEPGPFDSQLTAKLLVADITQSFGAVIHEQQVRVHYTALSYCWGAAVFPRVIRVNGIALWITENLFSFLQRFRDLPNPLYLWIDAVCINQDDLAEKSVQVSNMLVIYEQARDVVVWLGEETRHTKLAIQYLRRAETFEMASSSERNDSHSNACSTLFGHLLDGVLDLCRRDWVCRIWIQQEVWAAKSISVYCGTSRLTWSEFLNGPDLVLRSTVESRSRPPLMSSLSSETSRCFQSLRKRTEPNRNKEFIDGPGKAARLLELLKESVECQTTVEHDRVYALLGMASIKQDNEGSDENGTVVQLRIDYAWPIEKVYRDCARYIMHNCGVHMLLASNAPFGSSRGLDLPSWVPDLRYLDSDRKQPTRYLPEPSRADHERRLRELREVDHDLESYALKLSGFPFAQIKKTKSMEQSFYHRWGLPNTVVASSRANGEPDRKLVAFRSLLPCGESKHQNRSQFDAINPITMSLDFFGGFSLPLGAKQGDYLATVDTGHDSVVLRPVPQRPGIYTFVGYAWLYVDFLPPPDPTFWHVEDNQDVSEYEKKKEVLIIE